VGWLIVLVVAGAAVATQFVGSGLRKVLWLLAAIGAAYGAWMAWRED
jgi:hypothetical protein